MTVSLFQFHKNIQLTGHWSVWDIFLNWCTGTSEANWRVKTKKNQHTFGLFFKTKELQNKLQNVREASLSDFFSLFDVSTFFPFEYETKYNKDKCIRNANNNSDTHKDSPVKSEIGPLLLCCWHPILCVKSAV